MTQADIEHVHAEQVSADERLDAWKSVQEVVATQCFMPSIQKAAERGHIVQASACIARTASRSPSKAADGRPERRARKNSRRKPGGWDGYKGMERWQRTAIIDLWRLAHRHGYADDWWFLSYNPPVIEGEPDNIRKRRIAAELHYIDEAARRRGVPFIGVIVFEKPPGKPLHGHLLAHAPDDVFKIIKRLVARHEGRIDRRRRKDGYGGYNLPMHACPADHGVCTYITKECLPGRHYEPWRVTGEVIRGQRVTFLPAARDILAAAGIDVSHKANARPRAPRIKPVTVVAAPPPPPVYAFDAAGQFVMFGQAEPITLKSFGAGMLPAPVAIELETWRKANELSQRALAARIGIRQPHYANAIAGRDGLSRPIVARLQALLGS